MKEIKSILDMYKTYSGSSQKAAIAQVVRVEESSYRREGARMLIFDNGTFIGGISGGCLEGDTLKRSQIAILKDQASLITYDTSRDDESHIGVGLGCNGVIDVLILPLNKDSNTISLLQKISSLRRLHVLITVISNNHTSEGLRLGKNYYYNILTHQLEDCENIFLKKKILKNIKFIIERRKSKISHYKIKNKPLSVLVEYIPAQFHLVIYGDHYDVYPIIEFAKVLDWEISLVGNIQKLNNEKIKGVKNTFQKDYSERPIIDDRTAVLIMSHDFKTDLNNFKLILKSHAGYIGVLGPRIRYEKMLLQISLTGSLLNELDLKSVHAPVGLEIGANSPEEIAVSIFSEILTVFSEKLGGKLSLNQGPIHDRS